MIRNPGDIPFGTLERGCIAKSDRIRDEIRDNGNRPARSPRGPRWWTTIGRDDVDAQADEFRGETGKTVQIALRETGFNDQIRALHITQAGKPFPQDLDVPIFLIRSTVEESSHPVDFCCLLRLNGPADKSRGHHQSCKHEVLHSH